MSLETMGTETPTTEAVADTDSLSEAQIAMKSYEHYTSLFIEKIHTYAGSKAQLARAMSNAAVSPLHKGELHFSYPEEKELFELFTEANSAKLVLMIHGLADAGVVKILKPLMEVTQTDSEKELASMEASLTKPEGETVNG